MIILAAILAAPPKHGFYCGNLVKNFNEINVKLARLARFERATAWFVVRQTYQPYQPLTAVYFGRNPGGRLRICWAGGIVLAATWRGE